MRFNFTTIFSVLLTGQFFFIPAYAETIYLKSGKSIEGRVIDKTDEAVTVDIQGAKVTYYVSDIDSIDKKKEALKEKIVTFKVTKKFILTCRAAVYSLKFCMPLPRNDISNQTITDLKTFPTANAYITDSEGNNIAVFYFSNVRPGTKVITGVDYTVTLEKPKNLPDPLHGKDSYSSEAVDVAPYLAAERNLNPRNPSVESTALTLIETLNNPYEKGKALYNYLTLNMAYDYDKLKRINANASGSDAATQKPEVTLARKKGVCIDIATLYVALARACKIPARVVSGVVFDSRQANSNVSIDKNGHAWAELYLPGYGWLAVDPTFGINHKDKYFGFTYTDRVVESYGQIYTKEFGSLDKGWAMEVRTRERTGLYPIICDMETRLQRITD